MRVLLVLICALTLAAPAAAARLGPLSLAAYPSGQMTGYVEQQTWWLDCCTRDPDHTISNPDHAVYGVWDINEHNSVVAEGYLDGGASVTSPGAPVVWESQPLYSCRSGTCAWWGGSYHKFGVYVLSSSPSLDVETCFRPQGRCFPNGTPVYDATRGHQGWVSRFCGAVVYDPADPALQSIAGSAVPPNTTDGLGVPSAVTVTVTNTATGKGSRAKDVAVGWGFSGDIVGEAGCSPDADGFPARPPLGMTMMDYPFVWTTG